MYQFITKRIEDILDPSWQNNEHKIKMGLLTVVMLRD